MARSVSLTAPATHARVPLPWSCHWPAHLFVVDPAPIITSVERLQRKSGREVMARCPTRADADEAATWLADRISRLAPDLDATVDVDPGGGQFLVTLRA